MTEQIYKDTCLREHQFHTVYSFDYQDELNIYYYPENTMLFNPKTGNYEQAKKQVLFDCEVTPENAWLSLHPKQLTELCDEQGVSVEDACKLFLAIYADDIPQWTYHFGFGVYRNEKKG